jgi:hypothetical protein
VDLYVNQSLTLTADSLLYSPQQPELLDTPVIYAKGPDDIGQSMKIYRVTCGYEIPEPKYAAP